MININALAQRFLLHFTVGTFCVWPILNFILINFAENIISNAIFFMLAAAYLVSITSSILCLETLKLNSAKYLLPIGFISFFSFGIWLSTIEGIFGIFWHSAFLTLFFCMMQFLILGVVISQAIKAYSFKQVVLVGIGALFVPSLLIGIYGAINYTTKNMTTTSTSNVEGLPNIESKPNVYFIILDMYARQDVLAQVFGIDNSEFIQSLTSKGFIVDTNSFTNYPTTPLTLSTTFNMDFYSFTKDYSVDLIRGNSPAVSFFKSQGYDFVFIDSGGNSQIACVGLEDACLGSGNIDDDVALLLKMTPIWRLMRNKLFFRYFEAVYLLTDLENSVMRAIKYWQDSERPAFVFAHILSPHEPARFDKNCNLLFTVQPGLGSAGFDQYKQDLPCLNAQVLRTIDLILTHEERDPIILIQSDHGIRNGEFPTDDNLAPLKNFMSFYLPDKCKKLHYSGMTPVNNFRLLISCLTEREFTPVEDRLLIWADKQKTRVKQVSTLGNTVREFKE